MDEEKLNYELIRQQSAAAVTELLSKASFEEGDIFVVGCSSSEIKGEHIGKGSDIDAAKAVLEGIYPILEKHKLYLAAQCCEHLNRCLIIEKEALKLAVQRGSVHSMEICNAVPSVHAGGSFASGFFRMAKEPVSVEHIRAVAGMDIGNTLIGMHLRDVAVPVRLSIKKIGKADIVCARTRPKYIGGERAIYDPILSGGEVR